MIFEFKFPDVGEGITEGELVKWKVKEGDKVKEDQVLADIETDKAVVEIPSPKSGTISKLHHKEGDTIKVGEVLVSISVEGETEESKPQIRFEERKSVGVVGELEEAPEEEQPIKVVPSTKEVEEHVLTLPAVRRIAKELSIDISKVKGTGRDGRITEEDVRSAAEKQTEFVKRTELKLTKKYDFYGYIDHVPLKGIRKSIAKHMVDSVRTSPHVTHMDMIDVTKLWEIRGKKKEEGQKQGIHVTFMTFIVKAVVAGLKEHPYMNSTLDEEHEEIVLKKYYNIGVAVDTEEGLIVPVVKIADQKNIFQLAKEIEDLAQKTRERKVDLGDLKGGTFTITNVGSIGGLFATPIINQPEVGILALGKIHERPVVKDGQIVIRKMLPVSLAFDHRVLDGAYAARFTNVVKKYLEEPELLTD